MAGPAFDAAAWPVSTKMPAPMLTPTPKTIRSNAPRFFLSRCSGSSVSAIVCSMVFVRKIPHHMMCLLRVGTRAAVLGTNVRPGHGGR